MASVEVYGTDKRLMGHLHGVELPRRGRHHEVRVSDDPEAAITHIALTIELRCFAMDKACIEHGRDPVWMLRKAGVPDYADRYERPITMQWIYEWPVLRTPDARVSQIVFDLDAFEPDDKPCSDASAEAHWWMVHDESARVASTSKTTTGSINLAEITKLMELAKTYVDPLSDRDFATMPYISMLRDGKASRFSWLTEHSYPALKPSSMLIDKSMA